MTTGTNAVPLVRLSDRPLVVAEFEQAVADRAAGAVVSFAGVVRDHDGGRSVRELTYEAHPDAAAVLSALAVEELAADPALYALAVGHRIGRLEIGDAALVVAVACAHRGDAFDACRRVVDAVKLRLPVWKHQVFTDGTDEWVNCP